CGGAGPRRRRGTAFARCYSEPIAGARAPGRSAIMSSTTPGSDPDRPYDAEDTGRDPDVEPESEPAPPAEGAPGPEPVSEPELVSDPEPVPEPEAAAASEPDLPTEREPEPVEPGPV